MCTDNVVAFQGQCAVCNHIGFASTLAISINTVIAGHQVGRCLFYCNFAGGGISDFCRASCLGYHVFADCISANYVDGASIGNLSCTGVLCLDTNVLFWLCTANTACLTLDIDDTVCAQINRG